MIGGVDPVEAKGVVLAGGASERMGRDKASIEIGGRTLVERASLRLAVCCDEVLVASGGRPLVPGLRSVGDGPGRGPAAGILGAAAAAPGHPLLVLACDLPLVPAALLELLLEAAGDRDLVLPGPAGRLEPLCALYRPAALEALASQVAAGVLAPHRLARRPDLRVRVLRDEELTPLGDPSRMFTNLNRPEDLVAVESLLG
jgi:molybdopterin-guanine dinucleotide biosynthesis protein A